MYKNLAFLLFFSVVSANAGFTSLSFDDKEDKTYLEILSDWQYVVSHNESGDEIVVDDKNVYLGEGYGWQIRYVSPAKKVKFFERVETSGPTSWSIEPLTDLARLIISQRKYDVLLDGKVLETHTIRVNNGLAQDQYYVTKDDPEGEVTITVKIDDRVSRRYSWKLIPRPRH